MNVNYRRTGVALLAVTALFMSLTPTRAGNINDFRIYATNTVVIGNGSVVTNLDVGSDNSVQLQGAAGNVAQVVNNIRTGQLIRYAGESGVGGNLITAGEVRIGAGGSFVDGGIDANTIDFSGAGAGVTVGGNVVYATSFTQQANGIFGGTVTQGVPASPDLPTFPAATNFTAGGPNQTNPGALLPGIYGAVSATTAAGIHLSAGDYYMDSLSLSGSGQMSLDVSGGPIRLFIVGNATFGSGKDVAIVGGDDTDVLVEIHGDWTHNGGGSWNGTVFAPNGRIFVGNNNTFNGYLWAEDVDIEHSATIGGGTSHPPIGNIPEPSTLVLVVLAIQVGIGRRADWAGRRS